MKVKKHKGEITDVQGFVGKIKALSQEKEIFTKSLEEENGILREKLAQLTATNDAFIQENATISQLLLKQGIKDESGEVPDQPVQYLVKERVQLVEKAKMEDRKTADLTAKLRKMDQELSALREMERQKLTLERQVS